MPRWEHRISFRQYLSSEGEDDRVSREAMLAAADGIGREVGTLPPGLRQQGGDDLAVRLRDAANLGSVDQFNDVLEDLWDWLDLHRVWVEV